MALLCNIWVAISEISLATRNPYTTSYVCDYFFVCPSPNKQSGRVSGRCWCFQKGKHYPTQFCSCRTLVQCSFSGAYCAEKSTVWQDYGQINVSQIRSEDRKRTFFVLRTGQIVLYCADFLFIHYILLCSFIPAYKN